MKLLTAAAILALGAPTAALAEPIPAGVAAMIEAASKDPANLKVVADIAKQTNPGSAAEIDARLGEIAAAALPGDRGLGQGRHARHRGLRAPRPDAVGPSD